jgi:hypothetical protein
MSFVLWKKKPDIWSTPVIFLQNVSKVNNHPLGESSAILFTLFQSGAVKNPFQVNLSFCRVDPSEIRVLKPTPLPRFSIKSNQHCKQNIFHVLQKREKNFSHFFPVDETPIA